MSSFSHLSRVAVLLYPAFVSHFTNKTKQKKHLKNGKKSILGRMARQISVDILHD